MTDAPDYPGQTPPVVVMWTPGEPDDDLMGFHTRQDRDAFQAGGAGPFQRRVRPPDHPGPSLEAQLVRQYLENGGFARTKGIRNGHG